jgi:hypothetical protein
MIKVFSAGTGELSLIRPKQNALAAGQGVVRQT